MSVSMALVDLIPVILYLIATVILQRDLYNKMSKGAFALFAGGSVMVVCAGFYKALWKLLYGAGVCDFQALTKSFLPLQSTGFMLLAIGLIAMMTHKQSSKEEKLYSAAPAVFAGTMVFIPMMIFGVITSCTVLSIIAAKLKKKALIILFVIAVIGILGMGYMSTKDFANPKMNWIAQGLNCFSQGIYLLAVWRLHKAGLRDYKLKTA